MYRCSDWHAYLVLLQQLLHEEGERGQHGLHDVPHHLLPVAPPHLHLLHGAVLEPPELAAVAPELTGTPDMPPPPQTPGPEPSYSQNPTLDKRPPRPLALLATSRLAGAALLPVTTTTLS